MTPIQQMMLGLGGVPKIKYVDEIFSTYLWKGDGSSGRTITNNIATDEGTLTWIKNRSSDAQNVLTDTVRGANETLYSDSTNANYTHSSLLTAFTATGFTVGSDAYVNGSGDDYSSWTFKKKEGFCDIVTYTGTGSSQNISHSLGSIPGMIIVKRTNTTENWTIYHRSLGNDKFMYFTTDSQQTDSGGDIWSFTDPTSTQFTVGTHGMVNGSGSTYVAYVFAGGKSTAATAASCSFNGTSGLNIAASSDINFGTGTFCVEGWVYIDNLPGGGYGRFFQLDGPSGNNDIKNLQVTLRPSDATLHAWSYDGNVNVSISGSITMLQGWHHIAVVRDSSNVITQYVDGVADGTATSTTDYSPNSGSPRPAIGHYPVDPTGGFTFDGKISNLRVTVGEPVYTANFKPIAEPLTTSNSQVTSSSNVKLLCCNSSSSATASTVTPGTISNNGTNPTAYGNNPFDDPAGFKFGENEDQSIIKCGSFLTNSSGEANIYLDWEPQWVLTKRKDSTGHWTIFDSIRGWANAGNDARLRPNETSAEYDSSNYGNPSSTGFANNGQIGTSATGIYMAIRRPDGYVGKPADAGTGVFAMDTGAGNSTIPNYDSGFPVDFVLEKHPTVSQNWYSSARLIGDKYLEPNTTSNEQSGGGWYLFDSNLGWGSGSGQDSSYQSWMWKRGQGMDVVCYKGDGDWGRGIRHSLNQVPEMMWIKQRAVNGEEWFVYHKGLDGGTAPETHYLMLHSDAAEADSDGPWNDTAPTSTHFTLGGWNAVNYSGQPVVAFLFSSVAGISKVGYYDGSESEQTITTGFQPRFVIIKRVNNAQNWYVLDTTRGWSSGVDQFLQLNSGAAQDNSYDLGAPTSTGFTLTGNNLRTNNGGDKFIYYAHA